MDCKKETPAVFIAVEENAAYAYPQQMELAMFYTPWQEWCSVYEPEVALERGTVFPGLDKPFIGQEAVPNV